MRRIGDLLKVFLGGRLSAKEEQTVELVSACREILGAAGRHARLRDVRGVTLVLEVDHPGWGQLILLRKPEVLRRLSERFPDLDLRELKVVAGPGESTRLRPRSRVGVDGGPPPAIADALESVRDEGLRASLRRLYERSAKGDETEGN
jgi:hypothetical protein